MTLKGKVCLVTGATRGIGRAIFNLFVAEGAHVIGTYKNSVAEAENMVADHSCRMFQVDLASPSQIKALIDRFQETAPFHVLVNNAGINIPGGFDQTNVKSWDTVLAVNLRAPFLLMKRMEKMFAPGASVVNVSSICASVGGPISPAYASAKAGLETLSHVYARLMAPKQVRVNSVAPGQMDAGSSNGNANEFFSKASLLPGFPKPEDVARTVRFLASDESRLITGQTIHVDGGAVLT